MFRRYIYNDDVKPGELVMLVEGDEKAVDAYILAKYDDPRYGYSKRPRRPYDRIGPRVAVEWDGYYYREVDVFAKRQQEEA